jgi:hypothetical protein
MPYLVSTVRGAEGFVQWGYHRAATVRDWTLTRTEAGDFELVGMVTEADTFRLAQQPLVFAAPHARGVWSWPIVGTLQITGASCTARLGRKDGSA